MKNVEESIFSESGLKVLANYKDARAAYSAAVMQIVDNAKNQNLKAAQDVFLREEPAVADKYQSAVNDMKESYARSQTMGGRCDTRWLAMTKSKYFIKSKNALLVLLILWQLKAGAMAAQLSNLMGATRCVM